jgi:hypothetical protein
MTAAADASTARTVLERLPALSGTDRARREALLARAAEQPTRCAGVIGTTGNLYFASWVLTRNPVTGAREVVVSDLLVHREPSPDLPAAEAAEWRELLSLVRVDADDVLSTRVTVDTDDETLACKHTLADLGFSPQIMYTLKDLQVTPLDWPPGAVGRRLHPHERHFAVQCVSTAIANGLNGTGDHDAITSHVSTWLADLDGPLLLSYVVERDGRLVAHALVDRPTPDSAEAHLVDVLVPDATEKGHGWARLLTAHVEGELTKIGIVRLEATVVVSASGPPPGLLDSLFAAGWRVRRTSYLRGRDSQ